MPPITLTKNTKQFSVRLSALFIVAASAFTSPFIATSTASASSPPASGSSSVVPTGKYKIVSKGATGPIKWRLESAPGSNSTTCWRMVTVPKAKPGAGNGPSGARCFPPSADDLDLVDIPLVVASNGRGSKIGYVAIVVPKGTRSVRVGVIGGKFTTIARGKSLNGPIVFVGKKTPLWVDMTLPGKHRLACQGGVLMDKYDLKDPVLTDNSIGAAWFCDEL